MKTLGFSREYLGLDSREAVPGLSLALRALCNDKSQAQCTEGMQHYILSTHIAIHVPTVYLGQKHVHLFSGKCFVHHKYIPLL